MDATHDIITKLNFNWSESKSDIYRISFLLFLVVEGFDFWSETQTSKFVNFLKCIHQDLFWYRIRNTFSKLFFRKYFSTRLVRVGGKIWI